MAAAYDYLSRGIANVTFPLDLGHFFLAISKNAYFSVSKCCTFPI